MINAVQINDIFLKRVGNFHYKVLRLEEEDREIYDMFGNLTEIFFSYRIDEIFSARPDNLRLDNEVMNKQVLKKLLEYLVDKNGFCSEKDVVMAYLFLEENN